MKIKNTNLSFSKAERIGIIINKVKVTCSYINTIHDLIQGEKLLRYWNQQGRLPASDNDNID